MSKWKCSICWKVVESEVKPHLKERLCIDCKKNQQRTAARLFRSTSKRRAK